MSGQTRPKRLLILTSATGAGHDTHAGAAAEWCGRMYGSAVDVRIEHILEDSHALCRLGVDFYNQIQRRAPWFHHLYYNLLELPGYLDSRSVFPGEGYCARLFREVAPDAIISMHDCLNRGYFELARSILGSAVRCATFCAEFEGGYGFSRNWVNPRADYFFARTDEAGEAARRLHLPADRAVVSGHWAPAAFYAPPMEEAARTAYLTERLGLEKDRFTLLLSTGGAGAQNHADLLGALKPLGRFVQVVALAGRQEAARVWLEDWARRQVQFPVRVLSFTDQMPRLLQACSAVVARAGATTAGEALLSGCPVIFNTMGGIMPQEMPTWRYFQKREIGFRLSSPDGLALTVKGWMDDPASFTRLKTRMAACRDATTPEKALRLVLD